MVNEAGRLAEETGKSEQCILCERFLDNYQIIESV